MICDFCILLGSIFVFIGSIFILRLKLVHPIMFIHISGVVNFGILLILIGISMLHKTVILALILMFILIPISSTLMGKYVHKNRKIKF